MAAHLRKMDYGKNIHQREICTGKGDKSRSNEYRKGKEKWINSRF